MLCSSSTQHLPVAYHRENKNKLKPCINKKRTSPAHVHSRQERESSSTVPISKLINKSTLQHIQTSTQNLHNDKRKAKIRFNPKPFVTNLQAKFSFNN